MRNVGGFVVVVTGNLFADACKTKKKKFPRTHPPSITTGLVSFPSSSSFSVSCGIPTLASLIVIISIPALFRGPVCVAASSVSYQSSCNRIQLKKNFAISELLGEGPSSYLSHRQSSHLVVKLSLCHCVHARSRRSHFTGKARV
jgi:hypothetical protein